MNINETLLNKLVASAPSSVDYLRNYGCDGTDIKDFLLTSRDFDDRQNFAINIIERIFGYHGKEDLIRHIVRLAKIEKGIQELQPWQRDHVVHALICFILGIFINEKWMPIKVDVFEWKLACLLHDICYPAEFAFNILTSIPDDIKQIAIDINCPKPAVKATTKIEGLENLNNNLDGLDLIQSRVNSWGLKIDVRKEYHSMQDGRPCHGMYSALAALFVLDMMYQKKNPLREYRDIRGDEPYLSWNQKYFEGTILNACSAIFLHNLPTSYFSLQKINRHNAPTAFLLKLCDSLQEWERPSKNNQAGEPASNFDITITTRGLELSANVSSSKATKMTNEINGALEVNDVLIT